MPDLPEDYHKQKIRERGTILKWLGKATIVAFVIFGSSEIGGLFQLFAYAGRLALGFGLP